MGGILGGSWVSSIVEGDRRPVQKPLSESSSRVRFGLFELDVETHELRREGTPVRLQAQPKQVLAYLVRNADRVVTRDELRKAVWGDQTFVDFERGLNFCISQIRSALADDASQPRYIRTFARQGYQFIASVESFERQPPRVAPGTRTLHRLRWPWAVALAAFSAIGISAGYLLRARPAPVPIVAVVRFDNEAGDPAITKLSDGLTDSVVERLTALSSGQYSVVGNAQILRLPRAERDLKTIETTLGADFIVLGQVQAHEGQIRILAHLIRMPGQTHVLVSRIDRDLTNPLDLEGEAAQKIGVDFSQHIAATSLTASPVPSTR